MCVLGARGQVAGAVGVLFLVASASPKPHHQIEHPARGCVLGAGVPARGPWVCWLACLVACMLVRLPVVSWLKDAQIHPKTYARACHSAATSPAMCTIQAH